MDLRYFITPIFIVIFVFTIRFFIEAPSSEPLTIPFTYEPPRQSDATENQTLFSDTSLRWGLRAFHTQTSEFLSAATESLSSGVCVGDFNNDGYMDLFLVGGSGHARHYGKKAWWHKQFGNRIFLNKQGERFEDISESSGIKKDQFGTSCAVGDLNGDGFVDIVATGYGQTLIYQNNQDLTFSIVESNLNNGIDSWATSAALADVNQDGLLDVYISKLVRFSKGMRTFESDTGFESATSINFQPALYDPEPSHLYINAGEFQFSEQAKTLKVANAFGRSVQAKFIHLNEDEWPDIYILNDFGSPAQVYINKAGNYFAPADETMTPLHMQSVRDLVVFRPDSQGKSYFLSRSRTQSNAFIQVDEQGRMVDMARSYGLNNNEYIYKDSWGSVGADFNRDGIVDIYQTNGSLMPDSDSKFVTQAQGNVFYLGKQEGSFDSYSGDDPSVAAYSSRAVASIDIDNDGQLELLVANNNGPFQILEYQSERQPNWIGFNLPPQQMLNPPKLTVSSGNRRQTQVFSFKQGLFAQSDPRLHFGLGDIDKPVTVEIKWPNKTKTETFQLQANRYYALSVNNLNATEISSQKEASIKEKSTKTLDFISLQAQGGDDVGHHVLSLSKQHASMSTRDTLWNVVSTAQKQNFIGSETPNSLPLFFIREALREPDTELTLSALSALNELELEESIAWLIPLLKAPDEKVVCEVSGIFRHFFDEEEAVIHRKYLAIAPMLSLLETSQESTQICLLNALASSDNTRSVLGIMNVVQTSMSQNVKSSAIRALGLLRDNRAIEQIKRHINLKQSGEVNAAGLIALTRLSDKTVVSVFDQIFSTSTENEDLYLQLDTLEVLYRSDEAVVLPSHLLKEKAYSFLSNIKATELNRPELQQLIKVLALTADARHLVTLQSFLSRADTKIETITSLLSASSSKMNSTGEMAFLSLDAKEQQQIMLRFVSENTRLSHSVARALWQQSKDTQQLSLFILENSDMLGVNNVRTLILAGLTIAQNEFAVKDLLTLAQTKGIKGAVTNPQNYIWYREQTLKTEYVKWQFSQFANLRTAQRLQARTLLNQLLPKLTAVESEALLSHCATFDSFVFDQLVLKSEWAADSHKLIDILYRRIDKSLSEASKSWLIDTLNQDSLSLVTKIKIVYILNKNAPLTLEQMAVYL
jgi:hypothetical protein